MANIYDTSPGNGGAAVTPSDTTVLDRRTRALYVGTTGNLVVTTWDGSELTFNSVAVGFFPVKARKVMAATTASNIVAVW